MLSCRRRSFLIATAKTAAFFVLSNAYTKNALAESTAKLAQKPIIHLNTIKTPTFEIFYHLSQLICARETLDQTGARKMYRLFQSEPWGGKHIVTAYKEIFTQISKNKAEKSVAELITEGALGEGETWFVSHVLTTWYLGIYYHESREPERVLFEDALMWDTLKGYIYPPGFSEGEPGYWANPPSIQAETSVNE